MDRERAVRDHAARRDRFRWKGEWRSMPHEPGPLYDSFVVRLWQEAVSGRLLRAEVEHVQSGAVHVGRGVVPAWILDAFRACLRARSTADDAPDLPGRRTG